MRGKRAALAAIPAACAIVAATLAAGAQGRRDVAPPNDNRADALAIGGFPATVPGTTVDATAERLDPQRSQCGTVESTVWYRVDKAPDGTIAVSVNGTGLAPAVRIYTVTKNGISEIDCASAKASGTAKVVWETTRGNSYLVLVGKKTGAADGGFTLNAQLFLPPANDSSRQAARIGIRGQVKATTLGATSDDNDPDGCSLAGGTVWYGVAPGSATRVVLRLHAEGSFDAAAILLKTFRSQTDDVGCIRTNRKGDGILAWEVEKGASYFVVIGPRSGSAPGDFTLRALAAQPREAMPGQHLRTGGVGSRVDWLTDVNDIWWTSFSPGTTYRIAFSSNGCAALSLHGKALRRSVECSGYMTFTPGPDDGGRYMFEVTAPARVGSASYRLRVLPATADDIGVGLGLENLATARGTIAPSAGDVVDLYHFDVTSRSDVRLRLAAGAGASVTLLNYAGGQLGSSTGEVDRTLGPGHYVAAVRGSLGTGRSAYRLSLIVRRVTHTRLSVASAEIAPGASAAFAIAIDPQPSAGRVRLRIDRFDSLSGWQFFRMINLSGPGGTVSWRPPAPGRWRARASFLGTVEFSPSTSGNASVLVARPLVGGRNFQPRLVTR